MKIHYRPVQTADLPMIVTLEAAAFQMSKEMTERDMVGRIQNYPDTFIVAENQETRKVIGYTFGPAFSKRYIEDEIYYKNHPNRQADQYQMILSIVVEPAYRHHKIATNLLNKMAQVAKKQGRKWISLTCNSDLCAFYEANGYLNEGKTHDLPAPDDKPMYNMVKQLN